MPPETLGANMDRKLILSVVVATALASPAFALAEDQDNHGRDEHARQDERGAGPRHDYHKGDRLRPEEHAKRYEVNDWRERNLREPPKGYHWVRSGDDYVLAAVATGIIADLVLSSR
jgi:Ni/Co efflux regulator RcnB